MVRHKIRHKNVVSQTVPEISDEKEQIQVEPIRNPTEIEDISILEVNNPIEIDDIEQENNSEIISESKEIIESDIAENLKSKPKIENFHSNQVCFV